MLAIKKIVYKFAFEKKKPQLFIRPAKNGVEKVGRKHVGKLMFQSEDDKKDDKIRENNEINERDDVHSSRLNEALRSQQREIGDENDERLYKFNFLQRNNFQQLNLSDLNSISILNDHQIETCSQLQHNLKYTLDKPGIYTFEEAAKLIDKCVLLYFSEDREFLRNIQKQDQLDMDRFDNYYPPSLDLDLQKQAETDQMKFIMSSSTISNFLCQIYYALCGFKNPYFEQVFVQYEDEPRKYMISQRKPISNYIHRMQTKDGYKFYAMDGDKGLFKFGTILMNVGKIVERQLTLTKNEFEELFLQTSTPPPGKLPMVDHHRYMKMNNEIMLRSQIDCYSLNQSGQPYVFEIKSRAACPIRYDYPNCMDYLDYEIKFQRGLHSSYEREYYDLIRGAFLKWSFQLRIGRMHGAFIAYHNIRQIQGFEYVTSKEIDRRVFGTEHYAETIFVIGSRLLTTIINDLAEIQLKDEDWESIKIGVYAQSMHRKLIIFVELFKNREDIQKYNLVQQDENLQNEYDYFKKHRPLVNKVIKFEVLLKIEVNGIIQYEPTIAFKQGDVLNVLYEMRNLGIAQFNDYMNFLHDCYKFEEINLEYTYAGAWVKSFYS